MIHFVKLKKAPARDKISNRMMKIQKSRGSSHEYYQRILRIRYFPKRWKDSNVIAILKQRKNRTFPQTYRPISLLLAMSKIVERIAEKRIDEYTEELGIIPDEHFRFSRQHSTTSIEIDGVREMSEEKGDRYHLPGRRQGL